MLMDAGAKIRVLIADDVMEMRRSTRLMLTLVPELEVVAIVKDGRQAVEMVCEIQPDIEIALMDINMPNMDGIAAIRAMLAHNPRLACVVLSAERDNMAVRAAKKAGALGYLVKPYTADQFIPLMERVIAYVRKHRQEVLSPDEVLRQERLKQLFDLAQQYRRKRRTDNRAVRVYEALAADPKCDPQWLRTLAMMYVIREEWTKLLRLSARLDRITSTS